MECDIGPVGFWGCGGGVQEISQEVSSAPLNQHPLPPCSCTCLLLQTLKEGAGVPYLAQNCTLSKSHCMEVRGEAGTEGFVSLRYSVILQGRRVCVLQGLVHSVLGS